MTAYTLVPASMHICEHVCIHAHMYVCMYARTYVHMYAKSKKMYVLNSNATKIPGATCTSKLMSESPQRQHRAYKSKHTHVHISLTRILTHTQIYSLTHIHRHTYTYSRTDTHTHTHRRATWFCARLATEATTTSGWTRVLAPEAFGSSTSSRMVSGREGGGW